jgi:hypothetical protein
MTPHIFSNSKNRKTPLKCFVLLAENQTGGERGIRTLDALLEHARFPGVCLQPLGHLSAGNKTLAARHIGRNLFSTERQLLTRSGFHPGSRW